jgi:hypothetical protein
MVCHFLKDKRISIPLRRRFQFWLLSALSVFTTQFETRGAKQSAAGIGSTCDRRVCLPRDLAPGAGAQWGNLGIAHVGARADRGDAGRRG